MEILSRQYRIFRESKKEDVKEDWETTANFSHLESELNDWNIYQMKLPSHIKTESEGLVTSTGNVIYVTGDIVRVKGSLLRKEIVRPESERLHNCAI